MPANDDDAVPKMVPAEELLLDDEEADDDISEEAVKDAIERGVSEADALELYGSPNVIARWKKAAQA